MFPAAKVPLQTQSLLIAYGSQLVASWAVLVGRQNEMIEVATGVAHPPGGSWHNNAIPQDYPRVEVHTVKPEFMK
jgi:hypothetical protein